MAQEHSAHEAKAPWLKIFSAFKIALDMKKLALAGAGIVGVALGWWALSLTFYGARTMPVFVYKEKEDPAVLKAEWDAFKARRDSWNLLHELAGAFDQENPVRVDAADVARDVDEYKLLKEWQDALQRRSDSVQVKEGTIEFTGLSTTKFALTPIGGGDLKPLEGVKLTVRAISPQDPGNPPPPPAKRVDKALAFNLNGLIVQVDGGGLDKLKEYLDGALEVEEIEKNAKKAGKTATFETFKARLLHAKPKVAGLMRVCPWTENRGENPYLIVAKGIETRGESVFGGGRFFVWFFTDEAPVVLEPLYKFLLPVVYLFDQRAGGWDRLYLILTMLWTLVVWGFFGGAICRIAAVQVARNERITLKEAIAFTRDRCVSYIAAPVFPMVLVGILTLLLMVFGWLTWTPWLGEILGGVLWPIVLILGFVMAIVLVGLVGWPLMIATVSTEGTDSFDALSRSYSYIYQAPWQYVWSSFLAVVYGAVLVFFIGFMASLMVFMGKWGVGTAVGLASSDVKTDREPSLYFYYAPTSFGWRDLLIKSNARYVESKTVVGYDGRTVTRVEFTKAYDDEFHVNNKIGAALVSAWVYPLFLLVVGFGYSYFWSASTIIYFLMRKHVDDTEMDEVHVEDEEVEDFMKPPPAAAVPPPPPASKPGTMSLNVVDAPPAAAPAYTTTEPLKPPPENPPGH